MNNWQSRIIRFYSRLLRLYPTQFRAEFADEMSEVFAQTVRESEHRLSALVLWGEVRDLPLSLIREHLRERNQKTLLESQEGLLMRRSYFSPRLFRLCIIMLFSLFVLYVCSAAIAYIVFDLGTHSLENISQWWYAVTDQPGYIGHILPLPLLGMFLWIITPILIVFAGGLLTAMLLRRWRRLSRRLRWLGIAALLAGSAMFLTMGSPIGYMAALWFYD